MMYGFLFTGYKSEYYFWEVVVAFRMILIVTLTVFLTIVSSETQVLAGLLCLIVSMVLHVKFEPYQSELLNHMEHYSLQVLTLTMYAGMFYVTGVHYTYMNGDGVKWFFLLIILVPNIIFLIHWLNQFRIEMLKIALLRGRSTFKMLSCGLIDVDAFEKEHM
jgi:hypothetical protein